MQPLEPEDPRTLGDYRLLRRLGAGGMGRVYLARSAGGRTVAVKVVHPQHAVDEEFRVRFRREVAAARRVGGAWTAPVLDADTDGPVPWVATGYVAGPSLTQAVAGHGALPEAAVRALGAGLGEALRHVHGLGLVHRDVKPSNVLLTLDGPRLIDFGIARAMEGTASLTSTGVSVGSPGYMAPEQILGERVTGAADVFALGAVLAYAATGRAPFPGGSSAALLYHVVHGEPRLDGLPDGLRELVTRALAKDPGQRPAPDELVGGLAGEEGGAGLVRGGWLPAPLVEQVSRRAVELLELEPEAPSGSGPVPFTTPASGPDAVPPPPPPGAALGPAARAEAARPAGGSSVRPAGGAQSAGEGPGAGFGPPDPAYGRGRAGIVVERGAGDGAGQGRRRRVSCTLVLSIACVVAALLGTSYAFDLMPGIGGSGRDSAAEPPPGTSPSAPDRPGDGRPSGTPGAGGRVPEEFVGKWRGDLYSERGIPVGTLTVTIGEGGKGEIVAKGAAKLGGAACAARWRLVSATGTRLVADASGSEPGGELCAPGGTKEEFRLRQDERLRYESHVEGGGNAAGTLRRIG
ncbi:serine/threonine-protein kinase [Streptomyces albus]